MVGSKWEVLAERRYGALEDWMIETEYGIEDSSGKRIFYCIALRNFILVAQLPATHLHYHVRHKPLKDY